LDVREHERIRKLREAQKKAETLFHEVEAKALIRPGVAESVVNDDIYALAKEMYGITTYWHKRIVRAGSNTLLPYAENPPDLVIGADDIVFLDLGPVFEDWEADFGRTFVLGSDPVKHKLRKDIGEAFIAGKRYFQENQNIKACELYGYARSLAKERGWEYGGPIAGHLIGHFPHERIEGDKVTLYVHQESQLLMRSLDENGRPRHWILEIHFVDRARQIGGFYEELLTIESAGM
jgi:Xaa-Pro dipeptidase